MSQEWVDEVLAKAKVVRLHPEHAPGVARVALVSTYFLISKAPSGLLTTLENVTEGELDASVPALIDEFWMGKFTYRLNNETDAQSIIRDLFVRLRALDEFVNLQTVHRQPTLRPDIDWLVTAAGGVKAYLVPRAFGRRLPVPRPDRRGDIGRFSHRALIRHRVIPAKIGRYPVMVRTARVWTGRQEDRLVLGGALFPSLSLDLKRTAKSFTVEAVICDRHAAIVDDHIDRALAADCSILVFPELTIDPDRLAQIKARLKTAKPRAGRPRSVALVLAGSWHVPAGARRRNVATLLDERGRVVATHDKLLPYNENGRVETLELGSCLNVIVTEDSIVGLAICRDYCDRGLHKGNLFDGLDVDLMLVTSMGNASTMAGHAFTAQELRFRWRGSAFVVQQADAPGHGPFGHILFPDDDLQAGVKAFEKHDLWNCRVTP